MKIKTLGIDLAKNLFHFLVSMHRAENLVRIHVQIYHLV